ncbi:MAG: transcriptional regulator, ArsR family [Bryobacterales bacterium]|nr:transcriptional regulator, ArsR family [Bryobacterales bacterium]
MASAKTSTKDIARFADMFTALGAEPRLRIMRLLLSAHPDGLVVGEIQAEMDTSASTLSHHLDKLKNEDLVNVSREGTFLRCRANTDALQELLSFLYAECCTRNQAIEPERIIQICK